MNSAELAVVVPVYNEAANIHAVLSEWMDAFAREQVLGRVFVINDGSTDKTLSILQQLQTQFPEQLTVLDKANSGHGRTCRFGYEHALRHETPWIFQIDSDGQCDPAFFPLFWAKRNEADCIFGLRVVRDDGTLRRLISTTCRLLTSALTGRDLKDANVPYRLISRAALQTALQKVPPEFDLQNIALTLALKRDRGLRWAYVPIRFRERQGGTNSINLGNIVRMGFRMLTEINRVKCNGSPQS